MCKLQQNPVVTAKSSKFFLRHRQVVVLGSKAESRLKVRGEIAGSKFNLEYTTLLAGSQHIGANAAVTVLVLFCSSDKIACFGMQQLVQRQCVTRGNSLILRKRNLASSNYL